MHFSIGLLAMALVAANTAHAAQTPKPDWQADVGQTTARVYRVQVEENPDTTGGYDWGSCVMRDGDIYRMWWTRPCARTDETCPFETNDENGKAVTFRYSIRGDRIFYAESRDGYTWHMNGNGDEVTLDAYNPDSPTAVIVLRPSETRWERRHVANPSVVKVGGTFYLYYEAPSGFTWRIDDKGQPVEGAEYNNQVFVATSKDGRHFTKWPSDDAPQPIIKAPLANLEPGHRRYGLGQPSVCYRNGKFIMHYVDSCTWHPDTIVRVESSDPMFRNARRYSQRLRNTLGSEGAIPEGAVAKFAQTDVCYLGDSFYLVRWVYGTDRIAILRSGSGVFWSDDSSHDPLSARRQIALHDPRSAKFRGRWAPRFLRTPHGEIVGDPTHMTVFYAAGDVDSLGWMCYTYDIHRADLTFAHPLDSDEMAK